MKLSDTSLDDPLPSEWLVAVKNFNVTRLQDTESAVSADVCPRNASLNLSIIRKLKSRPEVFYPIASFGQYKTTTKKHGGSLTTLELIPFVWITSNKRLITREKELYTYLDLPDIYRCFDHKQLARLYASLSKGIIELVALYEADAKDAVERSVHLPTQ